jgi:hypothetical protein
MDGQGKKVVTTLVVAIVVLLLMVLLRPLFVGTVYQAGEPYTITANNGDEITVTPDSTISHTQADKIYSIVIFLTALIALVVLLLEIAGKI